MSRFGCGRDAPKGGRRVLIRLVGSTLAPRNPTQAILHDVSQGPYTLGAAS